MKSHAKGPLAENIELYLAHKRSLGKQLAKVGPMLHLLDSYLSTQGVTELSKITPAHIEVFVASRQRHSPRSYNGLVGNTARAVRLVGRSRSDTRVAAAVRSPPHRADSSAIPLQSGSGT